MVWPLVEGSLGYLAPWQMTSWWERMQEGEKMGQETSQQEGECPALFITTHVTFSFPERIASIFSEGSAPSSLITFP